MTDAATPAATLETVWLVEATYAPDAAETRGPFRAQHLAHAAELIASGVIIEIGAFLEVSSSIVMLRADSEAAALAIVGADIYMANGIWVELRARPFGRLVGEPPA